MKIRLSLSLLIKVCVLLTMIVIVLGAYTRLSDAGLGCPDWPGCYGQLLVPEKASELTAAKALYPELTVEPHKAWLEMIHRYCAASLGFVICVIAIWSAKAKGQLQVLPSILVFLVIAQGALGMWTVTLKLLPVVVMLHLIGGFTLLSLLYLLHCQQSGELPRGLSSKTPMSGDNQVPWANKLAVLSIVVLLGQILLGGWTSSNYAALMCTTLPICQGEWVSQLNFSQAFDLLQSGHDNYEYGVLDYSARMTIHVSHRFGAILTTIVLLCLIVKLWNHSQSSLKVSGRALLLLLIGQITLGISNVLYQLPLPVAVAHNLGAALLLLCLVRINYILFTRTVPIKHSQPMMSTGGES